MELLTSVRMRAFLKQQRVDEVDRRVESGSYRTYRPGETILDRHKVVRTITGGFGMIYFCQTLGTYGPIVIKTILPEYVHSDVARQSFRQEAENWTRLGDHENLVKALYVGELDECLAIHFDLVIGDPMYGNDLSGYLGRYPFRPEEVLLLATRFCDGMIYADQRFCELGKHFIHADIKPSNILISRDLTPKITDLGLVHTGQEAGKIANGTPGYIAPEVYAGSPPTPYSDIYSFGCVLYELFSGGKAPFFLNAVELDRPAVEWGGILQHKHKAQLPHDLRTLIPEGVLHEGVFYLLDRCLSKDPLKRFPDFSTLKDFIDQICIELGSRDSPIAHHDTTFDSHDLHDVLHELDNRAQSLSSLGLFEESLKCWDQMLAKCERQEPRALRGKGDALVAVGRYSEALDCYNESLKLLPDDIEQWLDKGIILIKQGNPGEAIQCFDKALSIKVQPNTIWGNIGHPVMVMPANSPAEMDAFQRLYENEIKKGDLLLASVYLNKAVALEHTEKHENALECIEQALGKNPYSTDAWLQKSKLLTKLEREQEATVCLSKALSIVPEEWEHKLGVSLCGGSADTEDIVGTLPSDCEHGRIGYLFFKGAELIKHGRPQEALIYLDEYLAFHEGNQVACWFKAMALNEASRPDEAIEWIDECISARPDWAELLGHKGILLVMHGEKHLHDAVQCFRRALEINDEMPTIHQNLIRALRTLGKEKEAEQCFIEATNVSGRWIKEGLRLLADEKFHEAINEFDMSLSFDNWLGLKEGEPMALSNKGTALLSLHRYNEALELFDIVLKVFPDETAIWCNRGTALSLSGKFDEALSSYNKALEGDPKNGDVYANKATLLAKLGRMREAKKCWRKSKRLGVAGWQVNPEDSNL